MEAERTEYKTVYTKDGKGQYSQTADQQVGPPKKFMFGSPDDNITAAVGGGYTPRWSPDFLQKEMGQKGICARFYYDKRIAVDVAELGLKISRKKRRLMHKHGFGYLCIPPSVSFEIEELRKLYDACVQDYKDYEELNPRPQVYQETIFIDERGQPRRAYVTAIDIKVGGGFTTSSAKQEEELKFAETLSKKETKKLRILREFRQTYRKSQEEKKPFRNPFTALGVRKYPIAYEHSLYRG